MKTKQTAEERTALKAAARAAEVGELTKRAQSARAAACEPGAGEIAFRIGEAADEWLRFQSSLTTFAVELTSHPAHTLAWSVDFASKAVEVELYEEILKSETPFSTIVHLRAMMMDSLLNDQHSGNSTGGFHRAMDGVRRSVYASLLRSSFVFAKGGAMKEHGGAE